ncbi:MAG: hypothetical protein VR73_11115 [Gammaproteobacteria bacterium BRH_c0]|nr:MAG: hypothetical protein VR73_11115 [Gammaproteobacteria bacterium BRH_c0]
MPAITEQPNKARISSVACHLHPIHHGIASIVVRKDLLLSGVPYLLGAKLEAENTFWTDVIVTDEKYLTEKHTVSASDLSCQLLKGIPSNIVNEVSITSLTDC